MNYFYREIKYIEVNFNNINYIQKYVHIIASIYNYIIVQFTCESASPLSALN